MSEIRPIQKCPICGAAQPLTLRTCTICGAELPGEPASTMSPPPAARSKETVSNPQFDPMHGDDDLYVGELAGSMWRLVVASLAIVVILVVALIGLLVFRSWGGDSQSDDAARVEDITTASPTAPPTATPRGFNEEPSPTATRRPTIALATVTPAPPTPTDTPTPGPCYQTAQQGDTVYGMATRCGHLDMAVVDLILELNEMDSPNQLQINQVLEIPWPTPTPGAEPDEAAANEEMAPSGDEGLADSTPEVQYNEFGTPDMLAYYQNLEPTLRPGQAWHTIRAGETIVGIAFDYDTSLETLSQINPELPFLQCDFGSPTGGENCSVMLIEGQQIRVPVPLAAATATLTPEGTLTPTPTATATFNAPYLVMPEDGTHFNADQIVTLRWGGTGTLGPDERYLVSVRDLTAGMDYMATVSDAIFILPGGWQPDDRNRHTFEWSVAIVTVDNQRSVVAETYETEPRAFSWDSR